ncbi:MAG: hypothetical protein FWC41_13385, partial [Firmicutes bacterium]|nr:hypothetical protein [Bacillota bacterium]
MSFFETLKNLKKGIKKLLGSFVMPYELEKEIDGILADSLDKNITGKNRNKILNNIVKQESIKEIRKKLSKILVKEKKSNKVTDKDLKDVLIERAKNLIGQASKGDDINSVRDLIFYSYLANSKITKFSENQLESIFKSDENDSLDFVDSNLKSEMGTSVLSILKILKNENLVKKRYLFSLIIKYFNYCRSINKTDKFPTIFGILNKYFNEYFSIFKKYLEKNKKGHEDLKNAIETIKPSNDFEVIDKKDYETKEISEVLTIPDECRHKIDSIIMEFKKKSDKIDENRDKTLTEMVNNKDLKKIKTYWNKILKKEKKEDKVTHEDLKNALIERAKELVEAFNKDYIRSFYTKSFSVTDIAFCAYLSGLKIEFPDNYISSIFEREEKNESVEFSYTIVTLDYLNKKKLIKKENFTYVLKKYAMYLNDQAKKSSTKKARFVHFLDMVRKNYSEEFSKLGEIVKEIENIDVSDILIIPDECEHEIDNFIMKFEYKKGYIDVNIEKTLDKMINEEDVEKIKTHWNKILIKEKKDEKVTDEHLQTAFVERAKVLVEAFNKDYIRSIYKKSFSLKDIAFCAYLSDSKVEFSDSYIPIFLAEEEKYENKYFGFADKSKNESASYTIIRLDYLKTRKLIEEETFSRIIKEYMTLLSEKAKKNKEKKEKFF